MAKSIPAIVNPKLLAWAREEAGLLVQEAASRMKRDVAELRAWEKGETQPTLRQAEKLAKVYHCSYSVFTLQQPLKNLPLGTEYRRLPGVKPGQESADLRVALRDMLYRRRVALSLLTELGETPESFTVKATLEENTEKAGERIRAALNIPLETQLGWKDDSQAWRGWRNAVEANSVLVLLFADVDPEEVRGVCLFHPTLPVIGINNHEVRSSRPFTLMHEFVHILLGKGDEEKPAMEESRSERQWKEVERFAEQVASSILMPMRAVTNDPMVATHNPSVDWSLAEIQKLARRYKVTPLAFATRLLMLSKMTPGVYRRWKDKWNEFLHQHPPKESGGFATPAEKSLNRNGTSFTTLVIEALTLDRITPVDASRYLSISYPHIEELRLFFAFGRPLRQRPGE